MAGESENFKIDVDNFQWIDGDPQNTGDLCAHGHVTVQIGSYFGEFDASISAAALYLLKTLSRDHIADYGTDHTIGENQLVPCCGFSMWQKKPDEFGEICYILGCNNGIDWTVKHEGDFIRLIAENKESVDIPFEQYKAEVFAFSDKVKAFYDSNLPRDISDYEEYDRDGFKAFCAEWKMHYEKWGYNFGKEIAVVCSNWKRIKHKLKKRLKK